MPSLYVKSAVIFLVVIAVTGCSTVVRIEDTSKVSVLTEERGALLDAAEELAWSPWPKPEGSNNSGEFASSNARETVTTRGDAVKIYLASLGAFATSDRIAADARQHILAANALIALAKRASDWPDPRLSDVAVIETSIGDLRETRAIYLSALRSIDADDDTIRAIREPLDDAVKALGDAADKIAESAITRRASQLAGPQVKTAQKSIGL